MTTKRMFGGHGNGGIDAVYCLAMLDDKSFLAGSSLNTIRRWDIVTGECLMVFNGHTCTATSLAVVDAQRFLSGSCDETVKLWNVATGECLQTFLCPSIPTQVVVLQDHTFLSSHVDGTILQWDLHTGAHMKTMTGHDERVWCMIVLSDGSLLSGSSDKTSRRWNIATGECLNVLDGHTEKVFCMVELPTSNDALTVLHGGGNGMVALWDIETAECLHVFETIYFSYDENIFFIGFLDDHMFTCCGETEMFVWDVQTGIEYSIGHLPTPEDSPATAVLALQDGEFLFGSCEGVCHYSCRHRFKCAKAEQAMNVVLEELKTTFCGDD